MQNDPNIYMEEEMVKISHNNVEKCKQTCSTRLKKKTNDWCRNKQTNDTKVETSETHTFIET